MAENKKLITVVEAARILGRSTSTIYAALNSSPPRLHYHDVKRRLLLREGLEARFNRSTRPRSDVPRPKPPEPSAEAPEQAPAREDQWVEIAEIANELIDASAWTSPPPWSADRWAGLAGVLDLARIEASSPCIPEKGLKAD